MSETNSIARLLERELVLIEQLMAHTRNQRDILAKGQDLNIDDFNASLEKRGAVLKELTDIHAIVIDDSTLSDEKKADITALLEEVVKLDLANMDTAKGFMDGLKDQAKEIKVQKKSVELYGKTDSLGAGGSALFDEKQ